MGKLIDLAPHKDFFKLGFPLDKNVVTKVDMKLLQNLSDEPRNVTNGGFPTPILNQFFHTQSPKILYLNKCLKDGVTSNIFFKLSLILKLEKIMRIGNFRGVPWG